MGWLWAAFGAITIFVFIRIALAYVESIRQENQIMESQLQMERFYDEKLQARVAEVRRFHHDVNGVLQAIEFSHGGGLVRAVVDLKRYQCEKAGIAFCSEVDDNALATCRIAESDVVTIVQNLLENAFEASLAVEPAAMRVVAARIAGVGDGGMVVTVSNRTASAEMPSFRTTKPDTARHGIGLRNVDEVAARNGGRREVAFDPATRMIDVCVTLMPGA